MTTVEPAVRRVLMTLLKRGAISVAQAAEIGCVSRQAVRRWVDDAGWNIKQRQDAFALREFNKLIGADLGRERSKTELRREAAAAVEQWEWGSGEKA